MSSKKKLKEVEQAELDAAMLNGAAVSTDSERIKRLEEELNALKAVADDTHDRLKGVEAQVSVHSQTLAKVKEIEDKLSSIDEVETRTTDLAARALERTVENRQRIAAVELQNQDLRKRARPWWRKFGDWVAEKQALVNAACAAAAEKAEEQSEARAEYEQACHQAWVEGRI